MEFTTDKAPGSFSDREVVLHFFSPGKKMVPAVLLLHGVHGWASPAEGNKYGFLARELAENGFHACIAESSRLRRDRETFGEDRVAWARAAFYGKSFSMEVFDACSAFEAFRGRFPGSPAVIWGFSLGGILSVLIAGRGTGDFIARTGRVSPGESTPSGIIVSGSGDEIRSDASGSLALPILDTLGDKSEVLRAASGAFLDCALFFYGSRDETFSEDSSRRIFDRIPLPQRAKEFRIIREADHSFRKKEGIPSREPLEEMLLISRAFLERHLSMKEAMDRKEA